jgi:hypothetical protein
MTCRLDDVEEVSPEGQAKQADELGDVRIEDAALDRLGGFRLEDRVCPPRGGREKEESGVRPQDRPADFFRGDGLGVRLAGIHQRRPTDDLEESVGEAVEVEQQIGRQRMPKSHPPEHHDDDRDDDGEVDEEVGDEGIQCN